MGKLDIATFGRTYRMMFRYKMCFHPILIQLSMMVILQDDSLSLHCRYHMYGIYSDEIEEEDSIKNSFICQNPRLKRFNKLEH